MRKNWDGFSSSFKHKDAAAEIAKRLNCTSEKIFGNHWLSAEDIYKKLAGELKITNLLSTKPTTQLLFFKKMKIIFLDIDGVLNSVEDMEKRHEQLGPLGLWWTDPVAVSRFNSLVKDLSPVGVCVSSTWRKNRTQEEMRLELIRQGVKCDFVGCTPNSRTGYRGLEIQQWLDDQHCKGDFFVDQFVILDDGSDMKPFMNHLVQTSLIRGLKDEDCEKVKKLFKEQEKTSLLEGNLGL